MIEKGKTNQALILAQRNLRRVEGFSKLKHPGQTSCSNLTIVSIFMCVYMHCLQLRVHFDVWEHLCKPHATYLMAVAISPKDS